MERIKLFCITLFALLVFSPLTAMSAEVSMTTLLTPQTVSYEMCNKVFNIPAEKLFYLSIASASANKFNIEEIQSKTGYILFTAVNKQFLATVVKIDANKSILKITPTNNVYYFQPGIVVNFFRYIEVNASTPITSLPKKSEF